MSLFTEVEMDTAPGGGAMFIKCEYNRDGDSYRSPWSNSYFPEAGEGANYPSENLVALERKANEVFLQYTRLYFDESAVSSAYFFDTDGVGAGAYIQYFLPALHLYTGNKTVAKPVPETEAGDMIGAVVIDSVQNTFTVLDH